MFTATSSTALITGTLSTFGIQLLIILGGIISIALGYLIFRFGWSKVKNATNGGDPRTGRQIMDDDYRVWMKRHRGNH